MSNPKNPINCRIPRPEKSKIQSITEHPHQKEDESSEKRGKMKKKKARTEEPNAKKPRESRNWRKEGGEIIPHQTPRTTRSQPTNRHPGPTEQP
jgi:hypothetical protein